MTVEDKYSCIAALLTAEHFDGLHTFLSFVVIFSAENLPSKHHYVNLVILF